MPKITGLLILCLCFANPLFAQKDSWKIYLDKKLLAQGVEPRSSDTTLITLKKSRLSGKKMFRIEYTEANPVSLWKRTFIFYDQNESLSSIDFNTSSGMFSIPMDRIRSLLIEHRRIDLYTFSEPLDEKLASAIRIRRIFVCRIRMKE